MKHLKGFLSFALNFYLNFCWIDSLSLSQKGNKIHGVNNKQALSFILLLIGILFVNSSKGATIAIYSDSQKNISIGGQIQILEDTTNKFSIHEAESSDDYKDAALEIPNLGVSNSSFWLKINIKNTD